jgi:hypothetical protein
MEVTLGMATSGDLVRVGVTPPQIDQWCYLGYLRPTAGGGGRGRRRHFPDTEVAVAAMMVRLIAVGFRIPAAERIARSGAHRLVLGPGISLEIADT